MAFVSCFLPLKPFLTERNLNPKKVIDLPENQRIRRRHVSPKRELFPYGIAALLFPCLIKWLICVKTNNTTIGECPFSFSRGCYCKLPLIL